MNMSMPIELKPLKRFFKRAEELDRAAAKGHHKSASIAYFCRSYALQLGLKIHRDVGELAPPTIMAFLLATMDGVEAAKASLPKYDGDAAKAFCQQFALSVFKRADDEDRNGLADKGTARTFYAAATFLDMLLQFGDLDPEIKDLPLYAKYKANDIIKALKEGRRPKAGPPGGDPDDGNTAGLGGVGGDAGSGVGVVSASDASAGLDIPAPAPSKPPTLTPAPKSDPVPTPTSVLDPTPAPTPAAASTKPAAPPVAAESRRPSSSSSSSSAATEDTGSNIALDMAIEMVKTAIKADHAQDYVKAFTLYKECLGFFMDAVKISKNQNTKATIMSRMDAYMKRAEQLKPMVKQIEARQKK